MKEWTSVRITKETHERLKLLCRQYYRSMDSMIQLLIKYFYEYPYKPQPQPEPNTQPEAEQTEVQRERLSLSKEEIALPVMNILYVIEQIISALFQLCETYPDLRTEVLPKVMEAARRFDEVLAEAMGAEQQAIEEQQPPYEEIESPTE